MKEKLVSMIEELQKKRETISVEYERLTAGGWDTRGKNLHEGIIQIDSQIIKLFELLRESEILTKNQE